MKIRQNVRHFAAKQALTMPVVGEKTREKLVDLHVSVFGDRAADGRREEREPRLEAFFDATMDSYLAALDAGFPEAEAREITHVQANFDFYNHGWTEMMEFPADEVEQHYERYADFFAAHDVTIDDPLGEFGGDLPEAPSTPEKLDDPEHPHAVEGFADDVYVETGDGRVVAGDRSEEIDEPAGDEDAGDDDPATADGND